MESHTKGLNQLNAEDFSLCMGSLLLVLEDTIVFYVSECFCTFRKRTTTCRFIILNMESLFLARP